ncbi:MAG: hypothetical protein AAGC55_18670, partial [Myxococcota bacterium]
MPSALKPCSHRLQPLLLVVGLAGVACAADPSQDSDAGAPEPPAEPPSSIDAAAVSDAAPEPEPEPEPPFSSEVRSLELKRSIAVRIEPSEHSELYGTIAAGTRVAWKQVVENEDCSKRWVEIAPFGWVCEVYLRTSDRAPRGVEVPRLKDEEIVPGVYGKVIGEEPVVYKLDGDALLEDRTLSGSVMVRRYGDLMVEELEYWRIAKKKGEYLARTDIREYRPSTWTGTRLGDDTGLSLPVGFPLSRKNVSHSVPVYSAAQGGRYVGKVKGRTAVPVLDIARDEAGAALAYQVGDGRWVRASEMRLAEVTEPPPLTGPLERWLDIDLDQQVLVAYEGTLPVYTTLVATGSENLSHIR